MNYQVGDEVEFKPRFDAEDTDKYKGLTVGKRYIVAGVENIPDSFRTGIVITNDRGVKNFMKQLSLRKPLPPATLQNSFAVPRFQE